MVLLLLLLICISVHSNASLTFFPLPIFLMNTYLSTHVLLLHDLIEVSSFQNLLI